MDRRKNLMESCVKELHSCIEYVQQYSGDNKEKHLDMLKELAQEYSEIDIEYDSVENACKETIKHFDSLENYFEEDVEVIYEKYLTEIPKRTTYEQHPIWCKVNSTINGASSQSSVANDEEISSDNSENEDVIEQSIEGILPSQFEPPIDPITKQVIKNPCKNRKCGHVYEYWVIIDHLKKIKQNKLKSRCPYIGCTNTKMKSSFIIKDAALKEQIETYTLHNSNTSENVPSCDITL